MVAPEMGGYNSKGLYFVGQRGPQNLKQFVDIVYRFWLHKRSKFEKFRQFTPDSWPVYLTVGAKRHFAWRGGLAAQSNIL